MLSRVTCSGMGMRSPPERFPSLPFRFSSSFFASDLTLIIIIHDSEFLTVSVLVKYSIILEGDLIWSNL